jgi:hypothetical protein
LDNNKLIIGVIVAVAAFLGAPFAMRALRPAAAPVAAAAPMAGQAAPAPYATPQNPGYAPAQPQAQQQQQLQQPQAGQQELNAQTLVGTLWEVRATQGTVKFQFGAGGQGFAIHPMAGQIPATWTCSGNAVNVTAAAFGQTLTLSALIQGRNLVGQGCSIHRLQ